MEIEVIRQGTLTSFRPVRVTGRVWLDTNVMTMTDLDDRIVTSESEGWNIIDGMRDDGITFDIRGPDGDYTYEGEVGEAERRANGLDTTLAHDLRGTWDR